MYKIYLFKLKYELHKFYVNVQSMSCASKKQEITIVRLKEYKKTLTY